MELGFIVDEGYGTRHVSAWARGVPFSSFFMGLKLPREKLPIGTFRCSTCGFIESYADQAYAKKSQKQFSLRDLMIFVTVVSLVLGMVVFFATR
jgi:hypothetical protein